MTNLLEKKEGNTFPLLYVAAVFMLTFFVYKDFGIRMIFGFALMAMIVAFSALMDARDRLLQISCFGLSYIILAIFITLFVLSPKARWEYDIFAMMISLDVSALFVLFANPAESEVKKALKTIVIFACILSLYTIAVTIKPSLYYDHISHFVTEDSARTCITLLKAGYGVAIGGNVVLIDYIVFLAILIMVSAYVIKGKGTKDFIKTISLVLFLLLVMILENRKSELLMAIIVIACCFFGKVNITSLERKIRNRKVLGLGMAAFVAAFAFLAQRGMLDRYLFFLKNFSIGGLLGSSGSVELTSGRIALWKKAVELFLDKPLFGIGWARFADHVSVYNSIINDQLENVHNNYLQLLCEVGVVGFLMVSLPMFLLFFYTVRTSMRLKRYGEEADFARIINSVSWGFQLFNLLISCIDPSWYKMSFWWFYAVVIILAQTAGKIEDKLSAH